MLCQPASAYGDADIGSVADLETKQLIKRSDRELRRGNIVLAEKILRDAIAAFPNDSTAKLKLAYIQIKLRRFTEAYDTSFGIAKAEPTNSYAFAVLGTTLLNSGRFKDARTMFHTAIKLDKREALAWAGLGLLEFYENNLERSVRCLREAVYLQPREADHFFVFGQVAARAEHYKEAADAYRKFLEVSAATDGERRDRIRGLIGFLDFLGRKAALYAAAGETQASVPFQLIGDRPIIELRVNERDKPLRFVLDTGSGISVISERTAQMLKVKAVSRGGFAKGIGGDGKFPIVYGFLKQIEVGAVKIRNVPVYIRKFHSDAYAVDGYIGLSLISKFLTTVDYGSKTLMLARKESLPDSDGPAPSSLPLRLTSSGFLSGEVQLEGIDVPLNFIFDTGASISVISDEVANLDAITPLILKERMRVVGSAGVTDDVRTFRLPKVSFGAHSRNSITAIALDLDIINEASGFEQAGILGGNFLKNYRMTFDFKNSRVLFVPVERMP